jgi:hypothetical protein
MGHPGEACDLLEETERYDERRGRVRDRRIAPVEHAKLRALRVDVRHVQVVMLNRFWDVVGIELVAELREASRERAQPIDLLGLERQLALQEVIEARGQRRDAQVRDTVHEVVMRVFGLFALELGVAR